MNTESNESLRILLIIIIILLLIGGFWFYWFMNKEATTTETKKIIYKDNDKRYPLELTKEEETLCQNLPDNECYELIKQKRSSSESTRQEGISSPIPIVSPTVSPVLPSPSLTESPVEPFMESENYAIEWDSVNAGGVFSASENYAMEDTVGEIGTGYSGPSENYQTHAGYQQMSYLSISCNSPINIGSIFSITGGTMSGNSACTVITDNAGGYSLSAKASTTPAFQSASDSFANYTPAGADPDYSWSVDNNSAEFGFSVRGDDIVQFFKDNGSNACNTGSNQTTDKCWYPFSTSNLNIASGGPNHPSGVTTTIYFKAESKKYLYPDTYEATITVTAITN